MAKASAPERLDRIRNKRVRRSAVKDTRFLSFAGVPEALLFEDASAVEKILGQIIKGWPNRITSAPHHSQDHPPLLAHVTKTTDGFCAASPYVDSPLTGLSPTSAACTVVADLAQAFVDADPDLRALHCGAVQINGQLLVLTGPHRAGKSTLIARLTAEPGFTVFCDDVLPITADGQGVSLGIAPRLRLPIPEASRSEFAAHVQRWITVKDSRYAYLTPPGLAPHGQSAPLGAFVLLDRRAGGPAHFAALPAEKALRTALDRSLADSPSAQRAFEQMHDLIASRLCLRLIYSDVEDAVALLHRAFSGPDNFNPSLTVADIDDLEGDPDTDAPALPVAKAALWQRSPHVAVRHLGQSHFLWMPDDPMLWELNLLGSAIWALLEIPGSSQDLAETLAEVFPDQPPERVLADVQLLLGHLLANGLIEPVA